MKLDNKGWGLNTLIICIVIILIALLISAYYIFILYNKLGKELEIKDNTPEIIEDITPYYLNNLKLMDQKALEYFKENNLAIINNQELIIKLDTLIEFGYIEEIRDQNTNNLCIGYSKIDNNLNVKSYLNCDNYISKGYGEY